VSQREALTSTLWDSSAGLTTFTLEQSTPTSYDLFGITLRVSKALPPQTGYLLSSGVCYELALDGDGFHIVRQFPWPISLAKNHPLYALSNSPG
jgi:hypothetical protein